MAGYSARQSSFTTGDTILAAHSNDEFNQVLAAFHATTGHSHDGTSGEGGPVSTLRDADALNKILVDTNNNHLEFYVEVSSAAVQQLRIQDGAIVPITDNDIDLGTSSLEFKDLFVDGTANIDALVADTADINGGTVDGATLGTNSAITQAVIDNININGATIGHTSDTDLLTLADGVLTVAGEVSMTTLDIGGTNVTSTAAELNILDGVTSTASELNLVDGITAGTVSASKAVIVDSNKDLTGLRNLTISGDLTVSGDDITMGTNTAGNLLIADGTNFNSVAVGSLSEISTVANDDVFLAVDTSGGGLKKITRSAVVSGLAASGAISNVVEDTSPQLGANLDTNSHNILIDDAHFIGDENGNEQIIFQTTSSAVNQFDVTNAATGNPPKLSATGGDSNIDFDIEAKGTGHVTVRGNTNAGAIQFNCESNSHGQILKSQPHSAAVTNVMLLPDGADSTLVSLVATQTLTNKTLTTPVIAEIDSLSSGDITLDADGDINLDAGGADINFKDDGTKFGHLKQSSNNMEFKSEISDADIKFKGNDGGSVITALTLDMSAAGSATFNHDIILANDSFVQFGDAGENIAGDGTDLTITSSGDINLDAGGADILFKDDGTEIGRFSNSSSDFVIKSAVSDKDLIIKGNDSGSEVTVLTFDMSAAGEASFGNNIRVDDNLKIMAGTGNDLQISHDGSNSIINAAGTGGLLIQNNTNNQIVSIQSDDASGGLTDYVKADGGEGEVLLYFYGSEKLKTVTGGVNVTGTITTTAANVGQQALTSSSNAVAWDATAKPNAFHVTTENTTFSAPTNNVEGAFIALEINYNGSHTIAFNTIFEFAASTAPTFTSTDGKTDILVFRYNGSVWQEVGRTLNLSES